MPSARLQWLHERIDIVAERNCSADLNVYVSQAATGPFCTPAEIVEVRSRCSVVKEVPSHHWPRHRCIPTRGVRAWRYQEQDGPTIKRLDR